MAGEPKRSRCAIYTRKSTEEGLEQSFNSLDAQREACAAYVLSQQHEGWVQCPEIYDDGGFSGGNMDRPGLKQLLEDIRAGRIDVVVVYKIDRLTRSVADFARIVDVFDAAGTSFVSVTQSFNTTSSMGRLTLNVLLSFAQFEREVIAERIRDKFAASKARGMWMGGGVPLGYRVEDRKLLVVPEEAGQVRDIMRRYLACSSVRALLLELERDGFVTKRSTNKAGVVRGGVAFRRGALFWLLANPIYLGKTRHRDQIYEGQHEAIVDQDMFDAVQAKFASHASRPRRTKSDPTGLARQASPAGGKRIVSLLTGMIFDQRGRPMSPCHTSNHGRRYRYYASNLAEDATAPAQRLPAGELEAGIRHSLTRYLRDDPGLRELLPDASAIEVGALLAASADLVCKAEEASTAGLRDILFLLHARITVTPEAASMAIDASALFATLGQPAGSSGTVTIALPTTQAWHGHEPRLRLDPPSGPKPVRDEKLAQLLARGFAARDELFTMTKEQRAAMPIAAFRHLERMARMAYLAPDIIRGILAGTQPKHLTGRLLSRSADLPLTWAEQRKLFGFVAN
jgi:site-specific DNA recombinase